MIYLDSSAIVKLVLREPESRALRKWLESHADNRTTCQLAQVEVLRACRRITEESVPRAKLVLAAVDLIPTTETLLESAALVDPTQLRSIDAVHVAAAVSLRHDLTAFVTYNRRLRAAAEVADLPVSFPA